MNDLYERLLTRITEDSDGCEDTSAQTIVDALRTVLELHKPWVDSPRPVPDFCDTCSTEDGWPCPTVRAIARALDVPIGDRS